MARVYRPSASGQPRKFREMQRAAYAAESERYHVLADLYKQGCEERHNKACLVQEYPLTAAELFYYFDDREIGGMIVQKYAAHPSQEYRELASRVRNVIRYRNDRQRTLTSVLGMHTVPAELLEEIGDRTYRDPDFE